MADYKTIITFNKDGSTFNTYQEAFEQHVADCTAKFGAHDPTITSLSDYTTYVAGQTMFTETSALVTGETHVAAGLAGNGYQRTRIWDLDKLITEVETNGWTNTADLTTNGWTGTFTDHDADTGEEYPSDYSISENETWAS